ncbi:MAG: hypothetical protein ACM3MG_13020 [Bacillota bacterium]
MMKVSFLFTALLLSSAAEARVFDISKDSVAPYFLLTGGSSAVGKAAYENEASGVNVSGNVGYNYSGEFGFMYSRKFANLRFGFEILKPQKVDNISGTNSSGTQLYTETSDILAYAPKLSVDFNLHGTKEFRSFLSLSAGYGSMTVKNSYSYTAAGTAAYPGVDSATEAKGNATLLAASLGYEGVLSDTTTYVFEFGYRSMKFDSLKYSKAYTTMTGAVSSGDSVMNGGSNRSIDFSGGFLSLGFRFYL